MAILKRESELKEIVRLIGVEALSTNERLVMEAAKSIREDFLQQHAFHPDDTFTSLNKQYLLLKLVLSFHHHAIEAVKQGKELKDIINAPVREEIAKAKYTPEKELDKFKEIEKRIEEQLKAASMVSDAAAEAKASGGGG
jgi:V/A-type H+-transporting ATPase subunit A